MDSNRHNKLAAHPSRTTGAGHFKASPQGHKADSGNYFASSITFLGLLALFPLTPLGFSVTGFMLAGNPEFQQHLTSSLAQTVPGIGLLVRSSACLKVVSRARSRAVKRSRDMDSWVSREGLVFSLQVNQSAWNLVLASFFATLTRERRMIPVPNPTEMRPNEKYGDSMTFSNW